MSKSPIAPSVLEQALTRVLNQKFDAQGGDWPMQCKAALERVLEDPELVMKLAEVLENIDSPESDEVSLSALPSNLALREFPASGHVDAISEGWPTGSFSDEPTPTIRQQEVVILPILPKDLAASFPVWLRHLLDTNAGRVLALDFRLPAALAAAGDGLELPTISIGESDSIRVKISSKEVTIDPSRMTDTEPLWLSLAVIQNEKLQVLGQWKFEQTVEIYPWDNSFKSGIMVVSTHPLFGN